MSEIIYCKEGIYEKIALILKEAISKVLLEKENVILGLPGGRSILHVLDELKKQDIDWDKVHVFLIDERIVPIDHADSNFYLINEGLSQVVPQENFHPFMMDYGLTSYETEIQVFGGMYDIVLLSSGEDGHIGALYPNHRSIFDDSEYYIDMDDSPKPPSKRISISRNMLIKSKIGILFFIGDSKREAYMRFLDSKLNYNECPAKLVQGLKESYVLTDIDLENK
jgi:6-phosphogluconolactonase